MSDSWSHLWSDYGLEEWRQERHIANVEALEEQMRVRRAAKDDAFQAYLDQLRAKRDAARGATPEGQDDDDD